MKKYIFLGGLIGCIIGLNSMMIGVGGQIMYYLSLGFIVDKIGSIIGGEAGIAVGIILVFLLPIVFYAFCGYTIGYFFRKK